MLGFVTFTGPRSIKSSIFPLFLNKYSSGCWAALSEKKVCVDLDFLLLLLDTHIADKDVSYLHELPFYVVLDYLLQLLDTYIAHKDIILVHELSFYAVLD